MPSLNDLAVECNTGSLGEEVENVKVCEDDNNKADDNDRHIMVAIVTLIECDYMIKIVHKLTLNLTGLSLNYRRPVITVMDARPMSEVGFRGVSGDASSSSTASASSLGKERLNYVTI